MQALATVDAIARKHLGQGGGIAAVFGGRSKSHENLSMSLAHLAAVVWQTPSAATVTTVQAAAVLAVATFPSQEDLVDLQTAVAARAYSQRSASLRAFSHV